MWLSSLLRKFTWCVTFIKTKPVHRRIFTTEVIVKDSLDEFYKIRYLRAIKINSNKYNGVELYV